VRVTKNSKHSVTLGSSKIYNPTWIPEIFHYFEQLRA
jgi:hypothetical protein